MTVIIIVSAAIIIIVLVILYLFTSIPKDKSEQRVQLMLNATPLGVSFWDKNLKVIDCNQNVLHMFGLSDKQEYKERFYELSPEYQPDGTLTKDLIKKYFDIAMKDGYLRIEWMHQQLNGEPVPCEVTLIRDKYKNDFILLGYTRDLREMKTMMKEIEQHARLLDIVNTVAAILLSNNESFSFEQILLKALDLVGHCLDVDRVQIWLNEVIKDEMHSVMQYEWLSDYGKTCREHPHGMHFPYNTKQEWEELFSHTGSINSAVSEMPEKNREFFSYYGIKSVVIIPIYLAGELWGFFSINDCRSVRNFSQQEISILSSAGLMMSTAVNRHIQAMKVREADERTQTERRKAEIAEESSKAKSDFLARMSHEIRTPMNAILGITEIQLHDESLPQTTKEALERIYNSGDLLLGIINDILDLSKIEAGKLTLSANQYDIASLIHDTVQLVIMRYESKAIEFKFSIDENLPTMYMGDELRIKQILTNLLSNAYKYTEEGEISFTVSFTKYADLPDCDINIVFKISDTGQGMTPEQVKKLGSEYSRFNMEANRKTEGTGLGMNITQNLIRLMNGNLHIESKPGVGSVFTVSLPQKCIDTDPIGKEIADNLMQLNFASTVKIRTVQLKREFMPYGRVLIVDDVETNLYVAKGLLAPYGLSIDTATSGFETIEKIKNGNSYDIIFMDHMMPKMDGIEATKIIRTLGYTKPIVALTANALTGHAEMFLNSGFDDFVSKPVDIRQLNMTLNKLIRDKMPPEVVKAAREQKEHLYTNWNKSVVDSQLAEFFISDAKKTMKILESIYINKCRREEDISMFIINIHAMKSALANVGENSLSAEAAKLEQAGRNRELNVVLSELPAFLEMLYVVICKFEAKEQKHEKNGEGDPALLKEKLMEIKAACSIYSKKAAKDLLAEIRDKTWPHEIDEWLGVIAGFLLHSEFEEAIKIIEEKIRGI